MPIVAPFKPRTITEQDKGNTPLQEYTAEVRYVWDMGIMVGPTGGDVGTPATVVQLYSPICFKVVRWQVVRTGAKALLPSPSTWSGNDIFVYKEIGGAMPNELPDTSPFYNLAGTYVYVCLTPPSDDDDLSFGTNVYGTLTNEESLIKPKDFWDGALPAGKVNPVFAAYPFTSDLFQGIISGNPANRKPPTPQ